MKIIGWTDYDNPDYPEMRDDHPEMDTVFKTIADELKAKGYKFNGYYHQGGDYGVPVFDDGTKFSCTFRTWGGIMALAYPDEIDNAKGLGYVEWAWTIPAGQELKPPRPEDYKT